MSETKPRVAIVFGGRSSEHSVSVLTAGSVLRAIDRDKYDVVPVGITTDGRWVLQRDDPERLAIAAGQLPEVDEKGAEVMLTNDPRHNRLVTMQPAAVPEVFGQVDVVFPLLHGPYGEDGSLQGLLEMAGVRYVGAGVLSSALGMDKAYARTVFGASGFPITAGVVITPAQWERDRQRALVSAASLRFPVFVKPARAGSSIGISRAANEDELAGAIEQARVYDPKVIVEAAVPNVREVECAVLGSPDGAAAQASVVGEIRYDAGYSFYDFEAKYLSDQEQVPLDIPADIPPSTADEVRVMAVRAFEAISGEGLARVDFFLTADGEILLNEINTMPGFTPSSMYPRLWEASGVDYPTLVDRLLRLALARPDTLLR